jgi:DNA-directed RNA polymerase specialized sigma24 family protein
MRAWVLTIMRHHFFDTRKKRADAMAGGRSVPEESSEWAYRAARADQIYFAKEALRLAVERLTKEQASVFWPTLGGATREECAVLSGVPTGTVGDSLAPCPVLHAPRLRSLTYANSPSGMKRASSSMG